MRGSATQAQERAERERYALQSAWEELGADPESRRLITEATNRHLAKRGRPPRWDEHGLILAAPAPVVPASVPVVQERTWRSKLSPIETMFVEALGRRGAYQPDTGRVSSVDGIRVEAQAQLKIETIAYSADFLFTAPLWRLVVELDGHDFHERTKEQAARDRSRDRALLLAGYEVARYTGSEVFADADRCLDEALRIATRPSTEVAK